MSIVTHGMIAMEREGTITTSTQEESMLDLNHGTTITRRRSSVEKENTQIFKTSSF